MKLKFHINNYIIKINKYFSNNMSVVEEVKKFEGEADQADDITVLAFKYLGQFEEEDSMIFDITIKGWELLLVFLA